MGKAKGGGTSKTNVAARQAQKDAAKKCKTCGENTEMCLRVSGNGKRAMVRICCEKYL